MKRFLLAAVLMLTSLGAYAQNAVTLSVSVTQGTGTFTTVVTWSNNFSATSCTAVGGAPWTGTKAPSGSETLTLSTSGTLNIGMTCSRPSDSIASVTWDPPTTNTDGTPYTNPKTLRVKYTMNATFTGAEACNVSAGIGCFDIPDSLTTRARMHTLTGITQAGTVRVATQAINQADAVSAPSNIGTKVFGAAVTVSATSVPITVNPRPAAPTNLVIQ